MAIPAKQRWLFYALALIATLAAVRWADGQSEALPPAQVAKEPVTGPPSEPAVQREPQRESRESAAAVSSDVRLDRLARGTHAAPSQSLFSAMSFRAPPPEQPVVPAPPKVFIPPPALASPPPPAPPPLPFAYAGKWLQGDKVTVFLSKNERNLIAREGDTLDGVYTVEKIGETALTLKYLPLGATQTLSFAASRPEASAGVSPADKDDEDD